MTERIRSGKVRLTIRPHLSRSLKWRTDSRQSGWRCIKSTKVNKKLPQPQVLLTRLTMVAAAGHRLRQPQPQMKKRGHQRQHLASRISSRAHSRDKSQVCWWHSIPIQIFIIMQFTMFYQCVELKLIYICICTSNQKECLLGLWYYSSKDLDYPANIIICKTFIAVLLIPYYV